MITDLTRPYSELVTGFSRQPAKTLAADGWNATTLSVYSHAGTHMDAPSHFGISALGIDAYNPARFITKAWIVEVEVISESQLITAEYFQQLNNYFEEGDSILVKTGWHKTFGEKKFRNGLPRISSEAAQWMKGRKINMLLVEPPSVADVNNIEEVTAIHRILLEADIIIVEGICNTGELKYPSVQIIALPLKIAGCDGAPARVIAVH